MWYCPRARGVAMRTFSLVLATPQVAEQNAMGAALCGVLSWTMCQRAPFMRAWRLRHDGREVARVETRPYRTPVVKGLSGSLLSVWP